MGEEDLKERLEDMGHGPASDLELLRYALLPNLPPLDTREGGLALLDRVDGVRARFPDRHVALIIDTFGRVVAGKENDNDTARDFHRWTGLDLRRRGVTWARLDHGGWDDSKGARGGSAKGDDVDVVWKLRQDGGHLELVRLAARMVWVPEKVRLQLRSDPLCLGHEPPPVWPDGVEQVAAMLDHLDLPLDVGAREARRRLREGGEKVRNQVIDAAVKWRRARGTPVGTPRDGNPGAHLGHTPRNPLTMGRVRLGARGAHPRLACSGTPRAPQWGHGCPVPGSRAVSLHHRR
jgi:hypothetical protein